MIVNKIKLVIWDLDDTFWQGTLTEGGVTHTPRNRDIVVELSRRGIISSICSKNDYAQVKTVLSDLGIWEQFVFPHIRFSPKGKAVAEMLEGAALRAENVLFIDDNASNREEVKFFNPGIMTAHPAEVLDTLLDHPHCAGKPDPHLTRLKQYQFLQRKVEDRNESRLSNEEFLRASNIRVEIDYDVDPHFDRIIELINRTNQLNYTKKRLNTEGEIEDFRSNLNAFGKHAGCVRVKDNYGDYGVVGFFLLGRKVAAKSLIHFVFSCRTMNMGVEQYVYEMLDKPPIDIAEPVSYALLSHARIDWINAEGACARDVSGMNNQRLVLLGGCDLLQLASYCSTSRSEFVNSQKDDVKVLYTDPCFVLNDRVVLRNSESIRRIPCWTADEAEAFDTAVGSADLVLLSLWPGMKGKYFRTADGLHVRLPRGGQIRSRDGDWFSRSFEELKLDKEQRVSLILKSFDTISAKAQLDCHIFVFGVSTRNVGEEKRGGLKVRFNEACRGYCEANPQQFRFIDLDTVVPAEDVISNAHFSRKGYFALAQHILSLAKSRTNANAVPVNAGMLLSAA